MIAAEKKPAQCQCSFCSKNREQVGRLIAGPGGVYICDECVGFCQEIIAESSRQPEGASKG